MTPPKSPSSMVTEDRLPSLSHANCIVVLLDEEGRVIFVNPFAIQYFGYQASELVGSHAVGTIFEPTDENEIDPASMIYDLLNQSGDASHHIVENRLKNGKRAWVVWSGQVLRDNAGRIDRILYIGNDISACKSVEKLPVAVQGQFEERIQEQNASLKKVKNLLRKEVEKRKRSQKTSEESNDRHRLYREASTEGILFHHNGTIIEANEAFAQLVECPRNKLIGLDIFDRFVVEDAFGQARRGLLSETKAVIEISVRTASGRTFLAESRIHPGRLGDRSCIVVTMQDITHRKKSEQKLIQSQKMEAIGTLAGGITHDFNNMLAGVMGNVGILRHQLSPDSELNKYLTIIEGIIERGSKLCSQILGYARGGKSESCEIYLDGLVKESLEMLSHAHRNIYIETSFHPDTPSVKGDRTQIEQVLLNLIINAVHAMPSGGRLLIETRATELTDKVIRPYEIIPGHYAMLSVQDTGHGMDKETQKNIFEPFFTTKPHGQGTGLGLASTYGIIKNHKGYIEVESRPGEGTRFDVLLPAWDHELHLPGQVASSVMGR